jgi:hypothetical protein
MQPRKHQYQLLAAKTEKKSLDGTRRAEGERASEREAQARRRRGAQRVHERKKKEKTRRGGKLDFAFIKKHKCSDQKKVKPLTRADFLRPTSQGHVINFFAANDLSLLIDQDNLNHISAPSPAFPRPPEGRSPVADVR